MTFENHPDDEDQGETVDEESRRALLGLLTYAQREALAQAHSITAQLIGVAIASLSLPRGDGAPSKDKPKKGDGKVIYLVGDGA
jgi:hypothetical protein